MNFLSFIPTIVSALFGHKSQQTPTQTLQSAPPELLALLQQLTAQNTATQPLKNSVNQMAFRLLPTWARNGSTTPQAPTSGAGWGAGVEARPSGSGAYDAELRRYLGAA